LRESSKSASFDVGTFIAILGDVQALQLLISERPKVVTGGPPLGVDSENHATILSFLRGRSRFGA
jgi:hypothetical protein